MDGRFAPSVIEAWMDEMDARDKWMALFASDPYLGDPLAAEIIGATYARQHPLWTRSSVAALTLTDGVLFQALAPGTVIAAIGAFDSAFNGTLLFRDLLTTPRAYPTGGTFRLDAGEYVVGLDLPGA